jgi:hypothetical protein
MSRKIPAGAADLSGLTGPAPGRAVPRPRLGLWDANVGRALALALTGQVITQVLGPGAFLI